MRGDLVDNRGDNYHRANGKRIGGSNYERGFDDAGGASRFFFRVSEQLDLADPVYYCAKASSEERDAGLGEMPLTTRYEHEERNGTNNSKTYYDPRTDKTYEFKQPQARNPHPTVKPIALARYLATLLLPPTEYAPRRLFIPFAGVASEVIGSMQAGWDEITGVELTEEYIPIAEARIEYWRNQGWQLSMFDNSLIQNSLDV